MLRGEIYFVDLDPVAGREQNGRRPVLVFSADWVNRLPLVAVAIPGSDGRKHPRDYPTTVRIPAKETGLPMETVFFCFQIRALDHSRFPPKPAGSLTPARMQQIEAVVRSCLEL